MRSSGRLAAAIEVLEDFEARRVPLKICLQDWARAHRFAGAGDRAWISGLCLDVLRKRNSLRWRMDDDASRAMALGALRHGWGWSVDEIAAAADGGHGPGALTGAERAALAAPRPLDDAPPHIAGDYPEWLDPAMARVFGANRATEGAGLAARAPLDLRINALKTEDARALAALAAIGAQPAPILTGAARIPAPPAAVRAKAVEMIPAFNKGWVEIQDLGSQIAAAAAGDVRGRQVLDFCAGGGGKTLALAAQAGNTGQIYAYDANARRLAPIYERLRRAGARNVQIRSPAEEDSLVDLEGKMDVVFIDAPCSGSGVWRRRPDAKWRLTERQLQARIREQDAALAAAAPFVTPGGRLVYVTCSLFKEENEDRLATFLETHTEFSQFPALEGVMETNCVDEGQRPLLVRCATPEGALRLTPARCETDGFFIAMLRRAGQRV